MYLGILSFLCCLGIVLAQSDRYAGTFRNDKVELQLTAAGSGAYAGTLRTGGQSYAVQAKLGASGALDGAFVSGGQTYRFRAEANKMELRLTSDGAEYLLQRIQPAASVLRKHASGLSLRVPGGWSARDEAQGVVLQPAGVGPDDVYMAATQTGYNAAEEAKFVQEMSSGFLKQGARMIRSGDREALRAGSRTGAVYTWEAVEPGTQKTVALKVYLTASGDRAFLALAAGDAERVRSHDPAMRAVLDSMQYSVPAAPAAGGPLADNTPAAQTWLNKLRGKVIKRFISGGGAVGQKNLFLAADGSYTYNSSVAISADVGPYGGAPSVSAGTTGRSSAEGRWRILDQNGTVSLQLMSASGGVQTYRLTSDNRNWYMNGEKAFAINP